MRRCLSVFAGLLLCATLSPRADAQGLRGKIDQLFIFGSGEDPLFLAGSADPNNPASIRAHGTHFVPSAVSQNGSIISFLTTAIAGNVSNAPIGSTSGGETFRFEAGVPVRTSTSAGPIFAERAQTLGRGRTAVGIGRSSSHFSSLRGVDLHDIDLFFTHENVDFAGCDSIQGGSCKLMGIPLLENDIMQFKLDMDINVDVNSILRDVRSVRQRRRRHRAAARVDVAARPQRRADHSVRRTDGRALLCRHAEQSRARRRVATSMGRRSDSATSRFAPRSAFVNRSARNLALLADARFATGDADELLGAGQFSARALAILSGRFGAFSPHGNAGYIYRSGDAQNDAVLATVGFDNLMADRVTLAVDLVSELQVGRSKLVLPAPVHYDYPFKRTIVADVDSRHRRRHRERLVRLQVLDRAMGSRFWRTRSCRSIAADCARTSRTRPAWSSAF